MRTGGRSSRTLWVMSQAFELTLFFAAAIALAAGATGLR
jgi:hypothetical protein